MTSPHPDTQGRATVPKAGQSCRSCLFLGLPRNKAGSTYITANRGYSCFAIPPKPVIPDSIRLDYSWRWPPSKSLVQPSDGANCPLWEERP